MVNGISKPSTNAKTLTPPLRIKAPSGSTPILLTGALKPPKPAFAVDIQRAPQVPPLETTIGKNSQAVADLLYTLNNFAPRDHAVLFSELDAAWIWTTAFRESSLLGPHEPGLPGERSGV